MNNVSNFFSGIHSRKIITTLSLTLAMTGMGAATLFPQSVRPVYAANPTQCIITIFGQQYDVTSLGTLHPGPKGTTLTGPAGFFQCGTDMTAMYQSMHGTDVTRLVPYIYTPVTPIPSPSPSPSTSPSPSPSPIPSPSPSVMPIPSPSPSVTPIPNPSPSVTPIPNPSPSVTPAPSPAPGQDENEDETEEHTDGHHNEQHTSHDVKRYPENHDASGKSERGHSDLARSVQLPKDNQSESHDRN